MPTTLVWKERVTGQPAIVDGYVQTDTTNPAFTISTKATGAANEFVLESHITGKENQGGQFTTLAAAKTEADVLLVANNIPQTGTVVANP